jgi:CubicO group peptidase (beta-lactamase class C family)
MTGLKFPVHFMLIFDHVLLKNSTMTQRRTFIKQIGIGAVGFGVFTSFPALRNLAAGAPWSLSLPRSTPEEQGVASADVSGFLDAIKASGQEFHSVMVIRHGHVIAEGWWYPFSSDRRQQLYSLSKSFTGTAIGLAVDEKRLSIDDTILSIFPEYAPKEISANLAALKVRHLLSMSVGHGKDSVLLLEASAPGVPWEQTFLSLPVVFEPGSQFMYNSGASYMLSSIINKLTGKSANEYLKPRLYDPLGIVGATWTENAEGVDMGASNLRIRTEDIGKLGQLYLQKGMWNGKQILSKEWVAQATTKKIDSGQPGSSWGYGYGYQFWMNPPGGFRADGAYGQYSMVFPDKDAVVVITSESADKAATMKTVWDHMYPAFGDKTPLPAQPSDRSRLQATLNTLAFIPPRINDHSPLSATISGKEYILDQNPFNARSVSFRFAGDQTIFTLKTEGKPDIVITCGTTRWIIDGNRKPEAHSLFSLRRIDFDSLVAASATWSDEHTLMLTFRFIEAIHGDSLTCIFDGDKLRIKLQFSAARLDKKPDDRADLTGRIVA